ncbi:hypothetical protein conserved [Leishmania donovani]|uniref:Uncharacterized protein n=3 Tax=Leishmania donovani species complex TaxID=38574 RepID=E9AHX5_LEIIN|nr:conserved hypothetical protein [Leishmania infantum JPCM5]CAC9551121.1 hypothetical_protein_-_conserved [Leishmania infantum]CAJ1993718.1 hypothetical protein conserved [Leishmania donovani]CBZ09033.1 conserved hypothetical protein [Leishmania infantum JPCM5]SUZ46724.1 hypothetical_protein_-_conserved [Leishmania infantum]VDZ49539.1 hypothetical_protein_conserved [Leishmania donovani]|eukprot:XP_003392826.1 conserved hypothetical protein [Leishmania infantum JPCM5]
MSRAREVSQKLTCYGGITLPNIPRIAPDEKSRQKYLSEYEKYEPELRRHHLGDAETTNTIGLKDVPPDFDRTMPSLLDPTAAEVEYERAREGRKAQVLRKGHRGASARVAQAAGTVNPAPAARKSISPQPSQTALADEEPQQKGTPSPSSPSSAAGTPTTAATAASAASEEAARLTPVEADGTRTWDAVVIEAAPAHVPRPPSERSHPKSATATTPMSQPRARTAPSLKPQQDATRLGTRTGTSPAASARAARPKSRPRAQPERATTPATAPTTPRRLRTPFAAHEPPTAESTARVLRVLLDPPQQYASSLHLDLSSFDLGWLRNGQAAPRHLTTIAKHFNDNGASPQLRINSPRSVIAFLENGASPKDWDPRSSAASASAAALGGATQDMAAVQVEVHEHRRAYVQAQRDALRRTLQDSYSVLCARVPFNELVGWYRRLCEADMLADAALEEQQHSLATAVRQLQERQRQVFETNKIRMMRQMQQAKELQERQEASVQRKLQAEAEAGELRRQKALEEQERRRLQQARLEAHRAERQRREEAYKQQLQARLNRAETCNAERMAARERQLQAMQQRREAQEAERLRRLERSTAVLEEKFAAKEQKRREKAAKLEQLRAAREARLAEERRALAEKQQRAAYLREEAKRRSEEAEEAARREALQRQQHAEERLREFQSRRHEEAAQRAVAAAAHHERCNEIRSQALAKEELFKATVEDKHRQSEEHHRERQSRQLTEFMWRREANWEEEEAKTYAVLQLQRIAEFNKLHTVVDLLEKRKAANAVVRHRELICEKVMRARDELRAGRDILKQEIEKSS